MRKLGWKEAEEAHRAPRPQGARARVGGSALPRPWLPPQLPSPPLTRAFPASAPGRRLAGSTIQPPTPGVRPGPTIGLWGGLASEGVQGVGFPSKPGVPTWAGAGSEAFLRATEPRAAEPGRPRGLARLRCSSAPGRAGPRDCPSPRAPPGSPRSPAGGARSRWHPAERSPAPCPGTGRALSG